MINRLKAGLSPAQIVCVLVVFMASLCLALALAWAFRKWNKRHQRTAAYAIAGVASDGRTL